jgi:hypothetical protein
MKPHIVAVLVVSLLGGGYSAWAWSFRRSRADASYALLFLVTALLAGLYLLTRSP